ncbi:hypothetical protein FOL47_006984 [Perkinsus chesapeaki]|uniref:PPM-type phosphatase domain-containing protein n=1 Tax=Perkinsus chesapeaki TaxID=330153 RepID=A0A7J6N2B1_PERCH|nr:hypothetical protein FOL47_006984 [Perkinsus chesapeaki]
MGCGPSSTATNVPSNIIRRLRKPSFTSDTLLRRRRLSITNPNNGDEINEEAVQSTRPRTFLKGQRSSSCNGNVEEEIVVATGVAKEEDISGGRRWSIASTTDSDLHHRETYKDKDTQLTGSVPVRMLKDSGIGYACKKGLKPESPNQDSFLIMNVDDIFTVYGVFDGHGLKGHDAILDEEKDNLHDEKAITKAMKSWFARVQEELEAATKSDELDATCSGSTTTLVVHCHKTDTLTAAWVGDSRAVLAVGSAPRGIDLTTDHRPDRPHEKARIEKSGGRVGFDGHCNYRVYVRGQNYPGLNMSRAMGDLVAYYRAGIIPIPDIKRKHVTRSTVEAPAAGGGGGGASSSSLLSSTSGVSEWRPGDPFLLLCSDGVWEFISTQEAVRIVSTILTSSKQAQSAAELLAKRACRRWLDQGAGFTMPAAAVNDAKKKLMASQGFTPQIRGSFSTEDLRKLFYSTTTKDTFVDKSLLNGSSNSCSMSCIHKIDEDMARKGEFKPNRAPFWPRDMSAYREQYKPLPLHGAVINKELAKTFRPASSVGNGPSPKQTSKSRYTDDYVIYTRAKKEVMMRPAIQTHIDREAYLLYTKPASHEFYPDWQKNSGGMECVGERCKPPLPKPTTSTMGFHFDAHTRYSEDYPPGSGADSQLALAGRESCKVLLEHGSYAEDNSSRIQGNSVPNRVRDYINNRNLHNGRILSNGVPSIVNILRGDVNNNRPTTTDNAYRQRRRQQQRAQTTLRDGEDRRPSTAAAGGGGGVGGKVYHHHGNIMSSYGMVVAIGSIGALFIVGGCSYKCIQWYQGRGFKYRIKGVKEWIEKVKLGAAKIILPKGHNIEVIGDGTEEEKGANMSYRRKRKAFNEKVGNRVVGNDKGSSQGSIASIVEGEADNVTGDGVQSRLLEGTSTAWQSMLQRRLMDDAMDVVKAREAERKARAVLEDIRIRWDELINGCSSSLSLANIAYTTLPDKGDICGVLPEGGEESFILCQVEDKVEEQQQCLMVALGGDDRRAAWVHMEGLCQIPTPIKATARALLRDMEKASDDLKAQVSITEDAMGKAASAQESLIAALEEEQQKKREPEEEGIAVEQSTMEEARPHQQQQAALDYWHPSLPPLPPALPKEPGDEDEGIDYSNKDINGGKSGMDYPSIHSSEARLHILGESTSNISMSSPVKEASKPREDDKGVPSGMPDLGLLKSWGTGHMAEEGKEKRKSGYRRGEVSRATVTIREKVVYNSSGEQQQEGSGNSYNDKYYDNIKEDYDRIDNKELASPLTRIPRVSAALPPPHSSSSKQSLMSDKRRRRSSVSSLSSDGELSMLTSPTAYIPTRRLSMDTNKRDEDDGDISCSGYTSASSLYEDSSRRIGGSRGLEKENLRAQANECIDLSKRLAAEKERREKAESLVRQLKGQIREFKGSKMSGDEKDKRIDRLLRRLSLVAAELEESKAQVKEADVLQHNLKAEIDEVKKAAAKERALHAQAMADTRHASARRIAELTEEKRRSEEALAGEVGRKVEINNRYRERMAAMEIVIESLTEEGKEREKDNEELMERIESMRGQLDALERIKEHEIEEVKSKEAQRTRDLLKRIEYVEEELEESRLKFKKHEDSVEAEREKVKEMKLELERVTEEALSSKHGREVAEKARQAVEERYEKLKVAEAKRLGEMSSLRLELVEVREALVIAKTRADSLAREIEDRGNEQVDDDEEDEDEADAIPCMDTIINEGEDSEATTIKKGDRESSPYIAFDSPSVYSTPGGLVGSSSSVKRRRRRLRRVSAPLLDAATLSMHQHARIGLVEDLKGQVSNLTTQLIESIGKLRLSQEELDEIKVNFMSMEIELNEEKDRIEEMKAEVSTKARETLISSGRAAVAESMLRETVEERQREKLTLLAEIASLRSSLLQNEAIAARQSASVNASLQEANEKVRMLETRLSMQQNSISAMSEQCNRWRIQAEQVESQLIGRELETTSLRASLEEAKARATELSDDLATAGDSLVNMETNTLDLQFKLSYYESLFAQNEAAVIVAKACVGGITGAMAIESQRREAELIKSSEVKVHEGRKQVEELQGTLKEVENDKKDVERALVELRRETGERELLVAERMAKLEEMNEELKEVVKTVEDKMAEVQEKLTSRDAEIEILKTIGLSAEQRKSLEEEIEEANKTMRDALEDLSSTRADLETASREVTRCHKIMEQFDMEIITAGDKSSCGGSRLSQGKRAKPRNATSNGSTAAFNSTSAPICDNKQFGNSKANAM